MEKRLAKHNQISIGQIALVLMTIFSVGKLFYLPSLMYGAAGRDSWLSGVLLALISWGVLLLIYLLIRRAGKNNLGEVLTAAFGKVAARVILLVFAAFFILHLLLPVTELYGYLNFVAMQKCSYIAFILPLLSLVWFMAGKGLTAIARNCELFAPFVFLAAVVLFAFSLPAAEIENLFPVGVNGASELMLSTLRFSGWFSDCAVLLIFIGKSKTTRITENEKRLRNKASNKIGRAGLMLSSILTCSLVAAFFVLFPAVFGASGSMQNFALSRVTEFATSNFLGHADRAAITVWLFGSVLKMSLLAFAAIECVSQAIPLKGKYTRQGSLAGLLAGAAALPVILTIDYVQKGLFREIWFLIAAGVLTVALPLCLLVVLKLRGEKNVAK